MSVFWGLFRRNPPVGFGLSFLVRLIFTPLVGLICTLLSDPLPCGEKRWGCIGAFVAILGAICLAAFLLLLLTGGAFVLAL